MATFTGGTKTAAATFSNDAANSAVMKPHKKAGEGYDYDSYLTYDEDVDPISGNKVNYDAIGTKAVWTPQTKN